MQRSGITALLTVLGVALSSATAFAGASDGNWQQWRGPNGDGVAAEGNPPITWSESKNIKWKVAAPDASDSTPIIWGDKIFLQAAVPTRDQPKMTEEERKSNKPQPVPKIPYKFNLLCLDKATGKTLWERTLREEIPHEAHHPSSSFAPYSPVTDGELIWVSFGSRGLYCYDLDGNRKWGVDLIKMEIPNGFGEGSSPAIAGDAVVVLMDHKGDSKVSAFNKYTGELIWERERDEGTSWSTPVAVEVNGTLEVITSATEFVRSYNAETGDLIWQCSGQTADVIPTPIVGFGNVYCASGYRGASLQAIKLGGKGDISDSDAVVWHVTKDTPYVASPVLYGERLYVTRGLSAYVSCHNARTGETYFGRQKLEGLSSIYASPVGAADHVYFAGRKGVTVVIKNADTFEIVATNKLDAGIESSPVISGDELFIRTETHLYCIAEQ